MSNLSMYAVTTVPFTYLFYIAVSSRNKAMWKRKKGSRDVRKRTVIRSIFVIRRKTADLS